MVCCAQCKVSDLQVYQAIRLHWWLISEKLLGGGFILDIRSTCLNDGSFVFDGFWDFIHTHHGVKRPLVFWQYVLQYLFTALRIKLFVLLDVILDPSVSELLGLFYYLSLNLDIGCQFIFSLSLDKEEFLFQSIAKVFVHGFFDCGLNTFLSVKCQFQWHGRVTLETTHRLKLVEHVLGRNYFVGDFELLIVPFSW
jgi:hypothetical protein